MQRQRRMAWGGVIAVLCLCGTTVQAQQTPPLVITGARIITGNTPDIERGTVVIQDDKIVAVGAEGTIQVPANAQTLDGKGLTLYPGLLDAYCLAGVSAPPTAPAAANRPGAQGRRPGQGNNPAPAAAPLVWRKATDGFDAKSGVLTVLRNNGYTTALLGTRGVLTPGEDTLVSLVPGDAAGSVLQERTAINVNTLSRGFSAYPGTLMGAYAFLRQSFYDAIDARNHPPATKSDASKPDPANDRNRLDALATAAEGKLPVFYAAQSENDIKRALRLAKEFNLRLIIQGGREAEKVLPLLITQKTPVVLTTDWSPAIALSKAGVPFALASGTLDMTTSDASELPDRARDLLEKGLSKEALLAALTRTPAELLGVSDRVGTIAVGNVANLVLTEGDLWAKDRKIKYILVKGRKMEQTPMKAASGIRPAPRPEDGVPYINVNEDDADGHGGGR